MNEMNEATSLYFIEAVRKASAIIHGLLLHRQKLEYECGFVILELNFDNFDDNEDTFAMITSVGMI